MREHGVPAFTVDGHRPIGAFDVLGVSFSTELGYTNLLTTLDLAGIPLHADRRTEEHPIVLAGGHAAFNPEPIADVRRRGRASATARRSSARSPTSCATGRPRAGPAGAPSCCCGSRAIEGCYVPSLYAVTYGDDGAHRRRRADRAGAPRRGHQAHHRRPRRVALPEGPARAAGRDRARARQRRDLPRLHARLPVLPGRDDHPAGAGAVAGRDRRDGRHGRAGHRASTRSGCCRCPAPTTPRSPRSPRASPTATRAPTPRSRCPPPASTRSTSTSPTRSAATAAAPGSRSPRRAARSGSAG